MESKLEAYELWNQKDTVGYRDLADCTPQDPYSMERYQLREEVCNRFLDGKCNLIRQVWKGCCTLAR